MARCYDEKHEFCFTDCPGTSCLAYYEEATQRCHRHCTTDKLDQILEHTLNQYGLGTVTSLHATGIKAFVLRRISRVYLRAAKRSNDHADAPFIEVHASLLDNFLDAGQDLPPLPEIRWTKASPLEAVRTLAHALLRPQSN